MPYQMLDEAHPEGECHQNAGTWARDNPGWKVVHGWLVFDYEHATSGLLQQVWVNPHSVVQNPDGKHVDPTPSKASQRYPFLEHEGAADDFIRIVQGRGLIRIDYDTSKHEIIQVLVNSAAEGRRDASA